MKACVWLAAVNATEPGLTRIALGVGVAGVVGGAVGRTRIGAGLLVEQLVMVSAVAHKASVKNAERTTIEVFFTAFILVHQLSDASGVEADAGFCEPQRAVRRRPDALEAEAGHR